MAQERAARGGLLSRAINRAKQFSDKVESSFVTRMTSDRRWLQEANAATSIRDFHSAPRRIEQELDGGVVERPEGTKEFFFNPQNPLLLKSPWAGYQAVFGSPFGSIDRIGMPNYSEPSPLAGTFRRAKRITKIVAETHRELTTMKGIGDYFRNAVWAVNNPQNTPIVPGAVGFWLSYVPFVSWIQDVGAARDAIRSASVAAGKIPALGRPFRGVVPQPGRLASDAITVGSDLIHLTTSGGAGKLFVPMPGSVYVIRPEQYTDARIKQQYLPEAMARDLRNADPKHLNLRQVLFVGAVNTMMDLHRDELAQTDATVRTLLERAGITTEPFIYLKGTFRRRLHDSKTRSTTFSKEEEAMLNEAITATPPRYSPQELSRLFSGLDVLEAVSETMRINRNEPPTPRHTIH